MGVIGKAFGEEPGRSAPILILMFINIHHYFTDGVIWKISNPEVRRDLFAHVMTAEAPSGARGKQTAQAPKPKAGKPRQGAKR